MRSNSIVIICSRELPDPHKMRSVVSCQHPRTEGRHILAAEFDNLTQALGRPRPRRNALRVLFGGITIAVLGAHLFASEAEGKKRKKKPKRTSEEPQPFTPPPCTGFGEFTCEPAILEANDCYWMESVNPGGSYTCSDGTFRSLADAMRRGTPLQAARATGLGNLRMTQKMRSTCTDHVDTEEWVCGAALPELQQLNINNNCQVAPYCVVA